MQSAVILAFASLDPMTLRPCISTGLPLIYMKLSLSAQWTPVNLYLSYYSQAPPCFQWRRRWNDHENSWNFLSAIVRQGHAFAPIFSMHGNIADFVCQSIATIRQMPFAVFNSQYILSLKASAENHRPWIVIRIVSKIRVNILLRIFSKEK